MLKLPLIRKTFKGAILRLDCSAAVCALPKRVQKVHTHVVESTTCHAVYSPPFFAFKGYSL